MMPNPFEHSGLLARDQALILSAIKMFPEIEQVILFGSRAKGTYKKGSDVDLAIKGQGALTVNLKSI
jgi:predicted nucleotidyltransferase